MRGCAEDGLSVLHCAYARYHGIALGGLRHAGPKRCFLPPPIWDSTPSKYSIWTLWRVLRSLLDGYTRIRR